MQRRSRQADAKEAQNYRAYPNCCMNCTHFTCDKVEKQYETRRAIQVWTEDKNLRCSIGNFAVKKLAVCDLFSLKKGTEE